MLSAAVTDRLDADVVGAGLEVLEDAPSDLVLVAPRHERVDERVAAAAGEIFLGEPEPTQVVGVVRQREIPGESLAAEPPCLGRIVLQQDELLGGEQLSGPQDRAGPLGVLDRHEVRMRAVCHRRRELEHRGP